jgi:hypothetical protein
MVTAGNNVDAYLDRDGNNVPDRGQGPGLRVGRAFAPNWDFTFPFIPGQDPREFKPAVVSNLFYLCNTMHDWMYDLGFTESARNFQMDNYGRGGLGGDPVLAEAQDGSGTDNANFFTPPDGQRPRMQMFPFTLGTRRLDDDLDSALDGDVVFHEYGHGVSFRLIGNGSGLGGIQSGAMGEGWSDYWAASAFDDGVVGEYVTNNMTRGVRRTAYDGRRSGPNGQYAMLGNRGFNVHNDGEIWCQALWDLRRTLGAGVTDQLVLAGMKMTVVHPSMLNARDGILAADTALNGGANRCAIWAVFARHGMGYSATGNDGMEHNGAADLPPPCDTTGELPPNDVVYSGVENGRDIALTGPGEWSTIPVASSNGDGTFTVTNHLGVGEFPQWASYGSTKLEGDFDGDGRTDIALTGPPEWWTIPVAFSNGGGTFKVTNRDAGEFSYWASAPGVARLAGDFNRDGRTDIALTGPGEWSTIPVAFSNGNGTFTVTNYEGVGEFPGWASYCPTKVVGDFNGDGRADIALTGAEGWSTIPVAFSNGDGTFTVTNHVGVGEFPGWASAPGVTKLAGDFNRDGRTDIALTGAEGFVTIPVAFSNGDGTFSVTNALVSQFPAWSANPQATKLTGNFR